MNNAPIKIYSSRKSLMTFLFNTAFMPAVFTVSEYLRGNMTSAFTFFIITMIAIILVLFYCFVCPDRWRSPLFIIDGNDLIVKCIGVNEMERRNFKTHVRINADRKNKLKYLNKINKQRYELIFRGIKPASIDIYLHNLSENDGNVLRTFIFNNYGDKLISNKINPADC
jgi:hypothetical protein